jgi:hypothetical protein
MSPLDLIRAKDGSMSLTKLAASTAHFIFAWAVVFITLIKRDFLMEMWSLYIGAAIFHASYDKTMATVKEFKDRKLDAEVTAPGVTTTTVNVTETKP